MANTMEKNTKLDVYRVDKTKLKLNYLLDNSNQVINIYLCIPKNQINISSGQIEESAWLHRGLITKRRYFGHNLTLKAFSELLDKAFKKDKLKGIKIHRAELNALWHQYRLAITKEIKNIKSTDNLKDIDYFIKNLHTVQEIFGNYNTHESSYVIDLENLINWYSLQSLQRFLMFIEKSDETRLNNFQDDIKAIIHRLYSRREKLGINTPNNSKELSQFLESLSLKKKALKFTDILKESVTTINYRYQVAVLGISAAAAMLALYILLINFGSADQEMTIPILIAIAFGYGLREIFKESIKNNLGNFYKQHFYIWKRIIKNAANQKHLATQWIAIRWLNERNHRKVEKKVGSANLRKHKILHYKSQSRLKKRSLPEGYEGLEESLIIDFSPFANQLLPTTNPIFIPTQDNKGLRKIGALFKCYLIVAFNNTLEDYHIVEFHINKDRIINLRMSANNKKGD